MLNDSLSLCMVLIWTLESLSIGSGDVITLES